MFQDGISNGVFLIKSIMNYIKFIVRDINEDKYGELVWKILFL